MIKTNFNGNYGFDPVRSINFSPFLDKLEGISIYYGLGVDEENTNNDKNFKVKINVETPNFIYTYDTLKEFNTYDLILHLCPYTCDYLNTKYNTDKFKSIFFPINPYTNTSERTINTFYTGGKHDLYPIHLIYRIMNKYIGNDMINKLNTEMSSTSIKGYYDKLNILSRTKICLVHNVLINVTNFPNYHSYINDDLCKQKLPWHTTTALVPQLKSRIFEGALMGCVLLVYKDEYKTIERYFEENKEFIYFESEEDLDNKVKMILDNYEEYKIIAENAKNKVMNNYLISNLVDFIIKNKK
jgi:hypothetical protein